MTEQLKFEAGKHYRTQRGDKRLCVWVFRSGTALFVNETVDTYEYHHKDSPDIIAEWREPRTWEVYIVEYADGTVTATLQDLCSVRGLRLARVTVTEGEGL